MTQKKQSYYLHDAVKKFLRKENRIFTPLLVSFLALAKKGEVNFLDAEKKELTALALSVEDGRKLRYLICRNYNYPMGVWIPTKEDREFMQKKNTTPQELVNLCCVWFFFFDFQNEKVSLKRDISLIPSGKRLSPMENDLRITDERFSKITQNGKINLHAIARESGKHGLSRPTLMNIKQGKRSMSDAEFHLLMEISKKVAKEVESSKKK